MPRPARYAKGLAKREEILATALEVIARTGYRRTSVRELATAVGLSQAGLLHYFSCKEELFAEVLRKRDEVDRARSAPGAGTVPDLLVKVVRHNADVPGLVQLHAQFSVEATDPAHPAHQAFVERYGRLRQRMADDLRARQAAGTLSDTLDADRVAALLLAVADGLQTQWLLDPGIDMAGHLDYLVDLLGLGGAPG
ncbi:HTH-type transcriptional regulator BetI [Propionicimonas sp. T2.31MG-18]|uniref:TetR/AcrR family transcriptional regulator n=1 Tax=Propionicimonas sp. T2.31MG-18 TaxID=3157620 RepID=UPI0035F09704